MRPTEYLFLIDKKYLLFDKPTVEVWRGKTREGFDKMEKFEPIAKVTYDKHENATVIAVKGFFEIKKRIDLEMIVSCKLTRAELYGLTLEEARSRV